MQVLIFIFLLAASSGVSSKSIQAVDNPIGDAAHSEIREDFEPRVFFRQMIEATGLLPIEINVPDTISTMWGGMSYMYTMMSSYFGGSGSGGGEGGEMSDQQISNDPVDLNSRPVSGKHRIKKVKRAKKTGTLDELTMFDLFSFLMF